MTARHVFGALLLLTPFIIMTVGMVADGGWKLAAQVWGFVFGLAAVFGAGIWLLLGDTKP